MEVTRVAMSQCFRLDWLTSLDEPMIRMGQNVVFQGVIDVWCCAALRLRYPGNLDQLGLKAAEHVFNNAQEVTPLL